VLGLGFAFAKPQEVFAANGANFNPGNIMSDAVMSNYNSMSAWDIQNFLNNKVPVCDTNGTGPYAGTTKAAYGTAHGASPPYICLKDYSENGISAAQIIWNKAQEFRINPAVILVLLQKEQGLITDDWPWPVQYRSATGYGCPDSTPGVCDSQYYGFTNQVHWANTLFRRILDQSSTWTNYYPPGVRRIYFNPNAGCGYTDVNIQNLATSALYNYTPYQPNAAALNNLYGTGDGCSAYGNRNFWRDYSDWFGSPTGQPYSWQIVGQTPGSGSLTLRAGEAATLDISARNTGTATWTNSGNNPVRLGTWPADRASPFAVQNNWEWYNRPTTMRESSVSPGGVGAFVFIIQAPSTPGTYVERFNLVAEGAAWMNDVGQAFTINVIPGNLSGSILSNTLPSNIVTDGTANATITVQNNGTTPWYNSGNFPVNLGTYNPRDRSSEFYTSGWLSPNRSARLQEGVVAPGQTGTFTFPIKAPHSPGLRLESSSLVAEGLGWFNQAIDKNINVQGTHTWSVESQAAYTNSSKSTAVDLNNLSPGQTAWLVVQARNTGTGTWQKTGSNPVLLGTEGPKDRNSRYFTSGTWLSPNRAATLNENSVAPDAVGTFEFPITVPAGGGSFNERFNLVAEGLAWFNDAGQSFSTTVKNGYQLAIAEQYAYTDSSKTTPVDLGNLTPGQTFYFGIKVRNTGTATWFKTGNFPMRLGTSRPLDHNGQYYHSSWLSQNRVVGISETSVAPNAVATFEATYRAPNTPGNYQEYLLPVIDGLTWLNDIGIYVPAVVNSP